MEADASFMKEGIMRILCTRATLLIFLALLTACSSAAIVSKPKTSAKPTPADTAKTIKDGGPIIIIGMKQAKNSKGADRLDTSKHKGCVRQHLSPTGISLGSLPKC